MSFQPVTTAIIGDNGFSTRRLPIAATIPKGFMPVGDRPVIDYVVDDLVAAGVTDIYFVILPYHRDIYERYFIGNRALDLYLKAKQKHDAIERLQQLRHRAKFHFIDTERPDGKYGTAVPPLMVYDEILGLDECINMASDDFTFRVDGGSDIKDMVEAYRSSEADAALLGLELPMDQLKNFGVMEVEPFKGGYVLKHLIEKPQHPEKLPPPLLANIGKQIIGPKLWKYLRDLEADQASGEYYIVDAYDQLASDGIVSVTPAKGDYYDVGTLENWKKANERELDVS